MTTPTLMYGRKFSKGLNLITAIAMGAFHVLAVVALFYIDTGAILTAVALYVVAGMLGIGMAYHRLLTHRGYTTYKWVEYFLTFCGTLALEGHEKRVWTARDPVDKNKLRSAPIPAEVIAGFKGA